MQIEVYKMIADEDTLIITLEAICDSFSSLLWDIEYYDCGRFEVYIAANPQNISIFQTGRIVGRDDDSLHFGIIESVPGTVSHVPAGTAHHSPDILRHDRIGIQRYRP